MVHRANMEWTLASNSSAPESAGNNDASQHLQVQRVLTDAAADLLVATAVSSAQELNLAVSIAVVDRAGQLLRFTRMSNAILVSVGMAQDKAYTAVSFGLPTHQWTDIIKDDPQLLRGIPPYPRLVILGGGCPINLNGELVGGIGVSGGHYLQDMEIAQKALAALR